jgi:uncharacterized membrane protein
MNVDSRELRTDRESHLRSVLKGVSWRIIGTIDTMVIAWFVTGEIGKAATIGSVEVFTKLFLYYLHERAWQVVPRGTIRQFWNRFSKRS